MIPVIDPRSVDASDPFAAAFIETAAALVAVRVLCGGLPICDGRGR